MTATSARSKTTTNIHQQIRALKRRGRRVLDEEKNLNNAIHAFSLDLVNLGYRMPEDPRSVIHLVEDDMNHRLDEVQRINRQLRELLKLRECLRKGGAR